MSEQQLSKEVVRKLAKEQINKCKDSCYSRGREAGNELEGDYGTWRQWENVLVKFANAIAKKQSIGFAEFCEYQGFERSNEDGKWATVGGEVSYTSEELYNLYLTSKK